MTAVNQETKTSNSDKSETALRQRKTNSDSEWRPTRTRRDREEEARRLGLPVEERNLALELILSITGIGSFLFWGYLANKYIFQWW